MTNDAAGIKPGMLKAIHYESGELVQVELSGGKIERMTRLDEEAGNQPWIAPGLLDLQINGYRGMDFNTLPIASGMPQQFTRALWAEGVTSYMPTVITNSSEAIIEAVAAIAAACAADAYTDHAVAGIHLEGPFISPEDGPRGAHGKAFVRPPDWELFQRWQEAAQGRIKIITLSPEWPGSIEFIEKVTASGVIVSIGHTSATAEQIREAAAAGARMSTHLGNGAHLMLPRHPNYIWEQLAQDRLWACMIADGFHLPESVLKVILKVKGERAMLVSDAVQLAGMPAGEYAPHIGGKVVLTPEGRLHLADQPNLLAGSAQMLFRGVEQMMRLKLCTFAEAWNMASIRPRTFLNGKEMTFGAGAAADFVLLDRNGDSLRIRETYVQGVKVY
ncbi:N-acetylglucosamine-6-phosphate deacetylase [Paenibacillus sp. 1011MAR3C5]|uniref:N-acetylglucosamine-6-phosphate deacetylase n=1 Tax=Paenibacillus sp. 1011MAR3C5 TaxID=1675787 RepID=UPI0021758577|nr:amidohydrolase family protein [Paenibacillus sp. 1011MAR3C5]